MLGAIIGDIIGSRHEFIDTRTKDFELIHRHCFATDDSILTVAVAKHLLDGDALVPLFHHLYDRFPEVGWGGRYADWAERKNTQPYNSFGNGSAMRVGPVGFAFDTLTETLAVAARTAEVTHNHPEGVKGAQATALAIYLARNGSAKDDIRREVTARFRYDLTRTCDEIRPTYRFNETCQETVPQAIAAFLDSTSYEDAIRNAVSLGGDADTLAAIAGPIAQAFYKDPGTGIDPALRDVARRALPGDMWDIVERFEHRFMR